MGFENATQLSAETDAYYLGDAGTPESMADIIIDIDLICFNADFGKKTQYRLRFGIFAAGNFFR